MLVYPKHDLETGVNILKFRVSFFVEAGGCLVQPCWFIRRKKGMNICNGQKYQGILKQALLILCGLLLFFPSTAPAKIKGEMLLIPVHIEQGMSLIRLVKEYCTSEYHWQEIARINNLSAPYRIYGGDVINIPFELLKRRTARAKVVSVIGDVFHLAGDHASRKPMKKGAHIQMGETLITGRNGFAIIALPENRYIRISSNSQFSFAYLFRLVDNSLKVEFLLEEGDVSVNVQQKLQKNETFRARTPFCETGVKGTFFRVKTEGEVDIVETLEGKVALSAADSSVTVREGMGTFVKEGAPPATPQALPAAPVAPELQQIYRRRPFQLPSPQIADGGHARLRICMDRAGEQTVWRGDAVAGHFMVDGLVDGTYYAFFTAVNADHLEGGPTAPVSFTLRTIPAPPQLASLYDGQPVFGDSVELAWEKSEEAVRYLVQVAADESFTDLVAEKETPESDCLFAGMAAGDYHFRVRAVAADGFSSGFSRTGRVQLKGVPTLHFTAPPSFTDRVELRWSAMGEDISYDIEIAADSDFSRVIDRAAQLRQTVYRPDSLVAGRYWVRMRAGLPTGEVSAWTPAQELAIPAPRFGLPDGLLLGSFMLMLLL